MSLRSIIAVVLALVLGGSAAVGVSIYLSSSGSASNADVGQVVEASVDLPRGTVIKAEQVKLAAIPNGLIHSRALRKLEEAIDRAVVTPMIQNEQVLDPKLSPKGSRGSMSWVTRPGMRAFTIQTATLSAGVAGFVLPGDRVDVLLSMNSDRSDETGGAATMTLLQDVEVMAVDQTVEAPAGNKVDLNQTRSVTLQVTPNQALILDLGQTKGTLHLSLRNPEDRSDARTQTATVNELRYHQEKSWDERVKGVLEAMGKILEKPKQSDPIAARTSKHERVYIRTIRGVQEGAVPVLRAEWAETGDH